jgi:hypothetical protein
MSKRKQSKQDKEALELERKLGGLLGWVNIEQSLAVDGTIIFTGIAPKSSKVSVLPQWVRDWRDCGPLLTQVSMIAIYIDKDADEIECHVNSPNMSKYNDLALRMGIVESFIDDIEEQKEEEPVCSS